MMKFFGYVFLIPGLFLIAAGTLRAVLAHTIIATLHFLTISDTVGLIFLIVSASFLECISLTEAIAFIVALMITGPLVTHVIARAYINSQGKEK